MKKVVNVSVGGRSFSLDEDAYARLTAYFDHFKALLDKDTQSAKEEVMTDLENRIAELFDQGTGGASYGWSTWPCHQGRRAARDAGRVEGAGDFYFG